MMSGFGSYSYSSNLSPSAPPFMVDLSAAQRPSPTVLVDFFNESSTAASQPSTSVLNPQLFTLPEFEEMAASFGTHGFPPSQPYNLSYASAELELLQALGYCGLPSSICESAQSSSMFGHAANLPLFEDNLDRGTHASKGSSKGEDSYNRKIFSSRENTRKKVVASAGTGQLNEKYFTGKDTNSTSAYNSRDWVLGSSSKHPESYPHKSPFQAVDSCSNEVSLNSSQENFLKPHGVSHEVKTTNLVAPLPSSSSEGKVHFFDASQLRIHLEGKDHTSAKDISMEEDLLSNTNVCNDASEIFSGEESNFQGFHIDEVSTSMALGCGQATKYIKNSFESLDHYNPTVDSPCWKGVPFSHSSPVEVSKFASLQLPFKSDEFSGSLQVFTVSSNDAVKNSSKNPSECSSSHGYMFLDHIFASSSEGPSVPSLLSEECESHDVMKAESNNAQSSVSHATQSLDYVNIPSNKGVLFDKSVNEPDINPYPISEQSFGEDVLGSGKASTLGGCLENFNMNVNDVSDCNSSHGPSNATGNFSSPCSSLEVDSAEHLKQSDEIFLPYLNVWSLVNVVHNLSELLLHECSIKASKLKEQESETLKKVIDNLDRCLMKTTGEKAKTGQASIPQQPVSLSFPNMVKLQEDVNLISHEVKEREKQPYGYGDAETVKDDKMTQSIKNILSWNFPNEEKMQPQVLLYKNLWLEAEAALCSKTYMARFNRIKNDIEKDKLHMTKGSSESSTESMSSPKLCTTQKLEPVLNRGQTVGVLVQNSPVTGSSGYDNDVMARLHILKTQDFLSNSVDDAAGDKSESFSVSPYPNSDEKSEFNFISGKVPDASVRDLPNVGKSSHVNGVMDRFQNFGFRVDEPNSEHTLDLDKVGQPSTEEKSNQIPELPIQDCLVLGRSSNPDNVEASVMARFSILKSRDDHSSTRDRLATENKVDWISDPKYVQPVLQQNVMSSLRTNMHGVEVSSAKGYESFSLDWEHVLKEELAG